MGTDASAGTVTYSAERPSIVVVIPAALTRGSRIRSDASTSAAGRRRRNLPAEDGPAIVNWVNEADQRSSQPLSEPDLPARERLEGLDGQHQRHRRVIKAVDDHRLPWRDPACRELARVGHCAAVNLER